MEKSARRTVPGQQMLPRLDLARSQVDALQEIVGRARGDVPTHGSRSPGRVGAEPEPAQTAHSFADTLPRSNKVPDIVKLIVAFGPGVVTGLVLSNLR